MYMLLVRDVECSNEENNDVQGDKYSLVEAMLEMLKEGIVLYDDVWMHVEARSEKCAQL